MDDGMNQPMQQQEAMEEEEPTMEASADHIDNNAQEVEAAPGQQDIDGQVEEQEPNAA